MHGAGAGIYPRGGNAGAFRGPRVSRWLPLHTDCQGGGGQGFLRPDGHGTDRQAERGIMSIAENTL